MEYGCGCGDWRCGGIQQFAKISGVAISGSGRGNPTELKAVDDLTLQFAIKLTEKKEEYYKKLAAETGHGPLAWMEMDPLFSYYIHDIPIPNVPLYSTVPVRVKEFNALDDWAGELCCPGRLELRHRLTEELGAYCASIGPVVKADWVPELGNIVFVKIPKVEKMENLRKLELGDVAPKVRMSESDPNPDEFAGKWARGVFMGPTSAETKVHKSFAFEVRLVDYGRDVTVHRSDVRRAVWRFLPFAATSSAFILMIHNKALVQYTRAVHEKWKRLLQNKIINVRLRIDLDTCFVVDLVKPTELQLEEEYVKILDGKVDKSLLPITDPFELEGHVTVDIPRQP